MTFGPDLCGQRGLQPRRCGCCKFFTRTGENELTGRVYGICKTIGVVAGLTADSRACKLFEVKK